MKRVIQLAGFDRAQLQQERPNLRACWVRAFQTSIEWSSPFKGEMQRLCSARGMPEELPPYLMAGVVRTEGVLLLWPNQAGGFPVAVSRKGRRTTTTMPEVFSSLRVHLPVGILIAVPVTRYHGGELGPTLALHFAAAQFLYRQSKGSAIGRLE